MAVGVDDWLVSDSEDEDVFAQLPPADGLGASVSAATRSPIAGRATSDTSAIQTAVFTPHQPRTPPRGLQSPSALVGESLFTPLGGTDLTIDNFTSVPSTSGAPSELFPKPRPRPRPRLVMKKAATSDPHVDIENSSFSHISYPPISATRQTNDSIRPATVTPFAFSDVVDDAYSSFDIAERAKMRSRKSQVAKEPTRPPVQINEVIELTSDEDELVLKPTKRQKKQGDPVPKLKVQTKPRPKPRLRVKPGAVLPSGSPPSQSVILDPAPLAHSTSSQPPPMSTLPTVPPSTPPQARELTPLSSPPVTTRKRKRIRPPLAEDDDEIDIIGSNPTGCSPSFTIPPPFFAPASSSAPTDSGIEIPPVESNTGRGKKKQATSGKTGTGRKGQNKGKKGKKGEAVSTIDETIGDPAVLSGEPSTSATPHNPGYTEERRSPAVRNSNATKTTSGKQTVTRKGKAKAIDSCEEEDELVLLSGSHTLHAPPVDEGEGQRSKENLRLDDLSPRKRDPPPKCTSTPAFQARDSSVKPKSTPMSELIRRANSQPSSPFPNASRTYSPFLKSSRTMLSRIAPLHPNRRTPPPPPPRPPPPKKSKKRLEMEERIEEELAETIDGWSCLTDEERKALRKARIDAELGYEE